MTSAARLVGLISSVTLTIVFLTGTRVSAAQSASAREVRPVSVVGDLNDITRAIDERDYTRANAGTSNYNRLSITLDIGEEQNVIGVIQDHGRWAMNYPGGYRVEVAESMRGRWVKAFEGAGHRGESRADFEPVRGRFVRITATDNLGGGNDWSIAEVRVVVDPGASRRFPGGDRDRDRENPPEPRSDRGIRDLNSAFDKNPNTRATTGNYNYEGASLTFDLGGEYELSRIVQFHGQWTDDYPAEYKVEVSRDRDESRFREVWRGAGEPSRSVASFRPVFTRYVRITALRSRDRYHWWSIAELRTNRDQDPVERDDDDRLEGREIRRVNAQGFDNASAIRDDNNANRATTGTVNYAGRWVEVDLGGSYTVSRVVQVHEPDESDFPGRYRIDVSDDGRRWQTVWQGQGGRGRSVASFNPVRARLLRITAISNHDLQHWWSIYKLRIRG